jgi:Family of unknown function (DUF6261)
MKQIQTLSLTQLSVLEFGQHIKTVHYNIGLLGKDLITDKVLADYLATLNTESTEYDKAMLQIAKSDETAKIAAADKRRDNALSTLIRQLSVFEFAEDDAEHEAYQSLSIVFNTYKGMQRWNLEEETNGIDNLLTDLAADKYRPLVQLLGMQRYVDRLATHNTAFKTLFSNRVQEVSAKEIYDVPAMRRVLKEKYDDMTAYVVLMAKRPDAEQYTQCLDVINTVRKYYHDLLAKRKPGSDGEPDAPIPPMA